MAKDKLPSIIKRLDRLEKAVFKTGRKPPKKVGPYHVQGRKGRCKSPYFEELLQEERAAPEVKKELEKYDYFYRIQVVQTTLNRLSKRNGPLAAYKEKGTKVYVNRK